MTYTIHQVQIDRATGYPLPTLIYLGEVEASTQPQALLEAFKLWPSRVDWRQGQGGFTTVRSKP